MLARYGVEIDYFDPLTGALHIGRRMSTTSRPISIAASRR
jgi:hypothetical protein